MSDTVASVEAERLSDRQVRVKRLAVGGTPSTTDGGVSDTTNFLASWDAAPVELWSASRLGREAYADCTAFLVDSPDRTDDRPFFALTPKIDIVSPYPGWDAYHPGAPGSCQQAVALAQVALCTAETLTEIASEVSSYTSRTIRLHDTADTLHQFQVAPQSGFANGAILEVALEFARLAMVTSGENLRSGLDRYGLVTGPGVSHGSFAVRATC